MRTDSTNQTNKGQHRAAQDRTVDQPQFSCPRQLNRMEAGRKAPTSAAAGGPSSVGQTHAPAPAPAPAPAQAQPGRGYENATTTHGDGPPPSREPLPVPDEQTAGQQQSLQPAPAPALAPALDNQPHNTHQTHLGNDNADAADDESAAQRQAAMDMVDRASAGQPVLSGPDPLGLDKTDGDDSPQHHDAAAQTQLQARGHDPKVSPKPAGLNL
jgi:hypothetical protein